MNIEATLQIQIYTQQHAVFNSTINRSKMQGPGSVLLSVNVSVAERT